MNIRSTKTTRTAGKARRGDPIRAIEQRLAVASIRELQAIRNALFVTRPRAWSEAMLHKITAIFGDYLECVRVWRGSAFGTEIVRVARPQLLRNSVTSRDGVTYVYTTTEQRTASKAGETDEVQIVTPNYLVDDFIEVEVVRGVTGITEVDQQRGRPIDKNVDGRAWATVPPAP